jgi:hypothetical protein
MKESAMRTPNERLDDLMSTCRDGISPEERIELAREIRLAAIELGLSPIARREKIIQDEEEDERQSQEDD